MGGIEEKRGTKLEEKRETKLKAHRKGMYIIIIMQVCLL